MFCSRGKSSKYPPQNAQASTYTLVKADAGKHINAGGNVTVNSGIFAIGDCISIFNDTTGDITIIQGSSVTLRLVADTGTGTRTLANYGLAAVLCVGSNEFVVSGGGVANATYYASDRQCRTF